MSCVSMLPFIVPTYYKRGLVHGGMLLVRSEGDASVDPCLMHCGRLILRSEGDAFLANGFAHCVMLFVCIEGDALVANGVCALCHVARM